MIRREGAQEQPLLLPPLSAQLPEVQPFGVEAKGLQSLAAELTSPKCHCGAQETGLLAPPGSSIHGIFQARVLEWVAIAFSENFKYYILNNK